MSEESVVELKGKAAIVTGGGTGLGREISLQLAGQGVDVAVIYSRSRDDAEQTVGDLRERGVRAVAIQADVADDAAVRAMVQRAVDDFGCLDILVNNAGFTEFVDFRDLDGLTEGIWDRTIDVNVKGVFFCTRAAAPHLRKQGRGKVVNVTSVSGLRAGGSSIAYSVSKAGETMLTKCLATALAPEIQVNAIAPGIMQTRWGLRWGEESLKKMAEDALLKRVPSLEDIAAGVLFLCENDSMTGQSVCIDGGRWFH
ncbi:MAG: SDR family oxidoreductase [Chloroflexi bacterium]|nr:SDR family oxidoreductase [Chloroflexota bacterium]